MWWSDTSRDALFARKVFKVAQVDFDRTIISTREETVVETIVSPFGLHQRLPQTLIKPEVRNVRLDHCVFPCTN